MNGLDEWAAERLKLGDAAALSALMDAYASSVHHLVGNILSGRASKEDVEECVSDTFVSVWNRIGEYDAARGTLRTWIHIIAKYKALDYRRKLSPDRCQVAISDELLQDRGNLERTVVLKSELDEVLRQVESLQPLDRAIFYRRYFYYESLESIAEETGLTRKAVENRLRRMRQSLRKNAETAREEGLTWT